MPLVLAIALGGAAGSVARWSVGMLAPDAAFPWATLGINVVGSLVLGLLLGAAVVEQAPTALRLALTVGFCGGFTTFSAFSVETVRLLQGGAWARAGAYAAASVFLAIAAAAAGLALGRAVSPAR
jgi:CrcB protein